MPFCSGLYMELNQLERGNNMSSLGEQIKIGRDQGFRFAKAWCGISSFNLFRGDLITIAFRLGTAIFVIPFFMILCIFGRVVGWGIGSMIFRPKSPPEQ